MNILVGLLEHITEKVIAEYEQKVIAKQQERKKKLQEMEVRRPWSTVRNALHGAPRLPAAPLVSAHTAASVSIMSADACKRCDRVGSRISGPCSGLIIILRLSSK